MVSKPPYAPWGRARQPEIEEAEWFSQWWLSGAHDQSIVSLAVLLFAVHLSTAFVASDTIVDVVDALSGMFAD